MKTNNPICPYSRKECIKFIKSDLDCKTCSEYGNGVKATGGLPELKYLFNIIKRFKWIFFTCPKTASEWAEQNENRITAIGNFLIFIGTIYVILVTVASLS